MLCGMFEGHWPDRGLLSWLRRSRLSVQPVTEEQWNVVMQLEKQDKADA